ncbi:uncharacterized protein C8R40DRAFT_1117520 [Lentinula edodes]|uniref:uncharacterized protein n=1 Tax=Lentinula edodes TaxID=5353 RepID=UPI001E8CF6B2|nr:uncharacterized protein C8R40DRAFT_1117520 [Lentinula edodes]KAH7872280.1 hypothetical protein C8R40DRAFT_1117520 [Lentinula edodes]
MMSATAKVTIYRHMQKYQSGMNELARNAISRDPWTPNVMVDEETLHSIRRLDIPRACRPYSHLPDMLSHRLGRFQDDTRLKQRMDVLFGTEAHKIFVNTSGAGKTRLVLEHLCTNWGLYLTCHNDSHIGSKDMSTAISSIEDSPSFTNTLPPSPSIEVSGKDDDDRGRVLRNKMEHFASTLEGHEFSQVLNTNNQLVSCEVLSTLLARFYVLRQFLVTLVEMEEDITQPLHIRNWLRLQLHPDLLLRPDESGDIFAQLRDHIMRIIDFSLPVNEIVLKSLLTDVLAEIRSILPSDLVIVLDECQFAAHSLRNAFRSDDWISKRPLLRQIAKCLNGVFNGNLSDLAVTFIFTGTGLSKNDITDALSSVVAKTPLCKDVNDTGAFDDIDIQQKYLGEYFPLHIWRSDQFPRLLQRIFRWLQGRHRFTAEYISVVLQNGYKNLDKLLNAYIYSLTGFEPTDYQGKEVIPAIIDFPARAFVFEAVSGRMKEKIKSLCYDYLLRSRLDGWLGTDENDYIAHGFARVKNSGGLTLIRIDEPLVMMACAIWLNGSHESDAHSLYKYVANRIQDHNPSTGRNGFEEFMCFYLQRVFRKPRRLGQVFDLRDKQNPEAESALAQKRATLVTLHIDEVGSQRKLVEGTTDIENIGEAKLPGALGLAIESTEECVPLFDWVKLKGHTAFCFPMNEMGPDIMCFLKLEDDNGNPEDFTYICLALQCKFHQVDGELEPSTLKDAIATVTPRKFFAPRHVKDGNKAAQREEKRKGLRESLLSALEGLPCRDPLAGKYGVMRVICGFPVRVDLDSVFYQHKEQEKTRKYILDPDEEDEHPLGKLKTEFLTSETAHLHPTDLLKVIKSRARKAKKKGESFWSTFDPAILWSESEEEEKEEPLRRQRRVPVRAKSFEFDNHSRMIIEMLRSDYGQSRGLDLPPRVRKRKRGLSEKELDDYEGDNED